MCGVICAKTDYCKKKTETGITDFRLKFYSDLFNAVNKIHKFGNNF